ncbi:response regulator [Desulfitobacterium sp.]|uniref:response regulator n=1 Tax=Desulfitobacterium sp. TaxID=49981 RepID=UPI002C551D38|nr:response regulator [Desulfitobacterium sp.]HVJ49022.1 response regulator [Desulfitobacterium sp.]
MRFRSKLFIGFGSILLLMAFIVSLSLMMLHDQNNSINELVLTHYDKIQLATSIESERANTAKRILDLLLDPSRLTPQEIMLIRESRQKSNLDIEEFLRTNDENQKRELLTSLQRINLAYEQDVNKVLDLLVAGKREEATHLFHTQAQDQVRIDIQEKSSDLQTLEHTEMYNLLTQSTQSYNFTIRLIIFFLVLALGMGMAVSRWAMLGVSRSIEHVSDVITRGRNRTEQMPRIEIISKDEIGPIALAYNQMADSIEQHTQQEELYKQTLQEKTLLETKVSEIITLFQGIPDLSTMANLFINKISPIIKAHFGVFYIREGGSDENERMAGHYFTPLASYACNMDLVKGQRIHVGEGLVGQCAQDHQEILLSNIPKDYFKIHSGLGEASPHSILLLPIEFEGEVVAVLEFASFHNFTLFERNLLERILKIMGITLHSVARQVQVKSLLDQSQTLTEELQVQSEELQLQHEELRSTNEQLEKQYRESEQKTQEIEKVSQFKTEFLANMSHELRTPLNSMLILAQTFAENKEGNLTPKQVEYAASIHSAGKDLLELINDILDLSKVESGKMSILLSEVSLQNLKNGIENQFSPVAHQKGLLFEIEISPDLPQTFITDQQHVLQILKNLLSNAFKFTEKGHIRLKFYQPSAETIHLKGFTQTPVLAVSVTDTGTGIPKDNLELIFEAFRQVDGTMSRKYGGTGLGLSICRELALLLGGTIEAESEIGKGSIFTLYLPTPVSTLLEHEPTVIDQVAAFSMTPIEKPKFLLPKPVSLEGKTVLIVDDDMRNIFALTSLLETHNMNVLFAENGREALDTLSDHSAIDLILMDIMMPEMDGYETMRAIRQIPEFVALPIIALTAKAMKTDREKCLEAGASDYIQKPVITEQLLSLMRVWLYERGTKN